MKITLKDGSSKEYSEAKSVYEISKDISEGLARVACAGEVDGEIVDLRTVLDKDCTLNIITASDEEGLRVIRHTASLGGAVGVESVDRGTKLTLAGHLRICSRMQKSQSDRQLTMVSTMISIHSHSQERISMHLRQR